MKRALAIVLSIVVSTVADDRAPADFERIEQLERDGKLAEAAEVCTKVLQEQKSLLTRVRALNKRAYFRTELKQYDAALADTDEVLKFSKSDAQTYLTRGYVFEKKGQYQDAVTAYGRAFALEPSCVNCLLRRAQTHSKFGYTDLALADYSAAIGVPGAPPILYGYRADQYFELGDFERTIDDLQTYLRLVDAIYVKDSAYAELGLSQIFLGNKRDGWDNLARTARLQGKTPAEQAQVMAAVCGLVGEMKFALTNYDRAISLESTNAAYFMWRAEVKRVAGDIDGALVDFSRSISLGNTNSELQIDRGLAYLAKGQDKKALEEFQRMILEDFESDTCYMAGAYLTGMNANREAALKLVDQGIEKIEGKQYLQLWHVLLAGRPHKSFVDELSQHNPKKWPYPLLQFYNGKMSQEDVLKFAEHRNPNVRRKQRVEAFFYIAGRLLREGDPAKAREYFENAVASSPWAEPTERILAQKELESHGLEKLLAPSPLKQN
jgi:tetratricopeptide (TPR) repeat protein